MGLEIEAMRARVISYLTREGIKDWSMSEPCDCRASTAVPVMASIVTFNYEEILVGCDANAIVMQESWTLRGGMEWGNREVQACMKLRDTSGNELYMTNVLDEGGIDSFLREHIVSGEKFISYKTKMLLEQQTENERIDIIRKCVPDKIITDLVQSVMAAGIHSLGKEAALESKNRFVAHISTLIRQRFDEFS